MEPALLIPIIVPLGLFALIFGIVYMNKKENLAMIDKGMNPKNQEAKGPEPFRYLKWGLLLVGAGLGLLVAYLIDINLHTPDTNDRAPLYFALIAIGGGAGLIVSYKMEMKEIKEVKQRVVSLSALPSEL